MTHALEEYRNARKLALKAYSSYISQGRSGYLPFLDGVLKNIEIVSEVDLGTVEIPLKKIKGTYTYLRSISFAQNYMPLAGEGTEFSSKWSAVYEAQIEEGLRDPIKVYEYLNWFYVIEGNKRVSVLKYLDVYTYHAEVVRMIPKYDEKNKDIRLYYAFLKFYKNTGINTIWFSEEQSFHDLWKLIRNYEPSSTAVAVKDRFKYFISAVYGVFRKVYHDLGGQRLPITTGDAFLDYIKLNGVPDQYFEEHLKPSLRRFIVELEYYKEKADIEVQTEPSLKTEGGILNRLTHMIRQEGRIKVGFALAKDIRTSSWSYAHDLGRMHLEKVMGDQIETVSVDRVPESIEACPRLKELVESGCQVIFSTSPLMINATLKIAMDYPQAVFLNCSELYSFKQVHTYFGRIYESRFLSGIAAGAMTQEDRVGYIATCAAAEVVSGINAFAIGAKMANPSVKVFLEWMGEWDNTEKSQKAGIRLAEQGVDIISHHNTLANRKFSKEYGVYTVEYQEEKNIITPKEYLAVPVWNWGIFYEKIVKSFMGGGLKPMGDYLSSGKKQIRNYWWGMDSGILDFFYSKKLLPSETQKLLEIVKEAIVHRKHRVFSGPLFDQKGKLMIPQGKAATREEILSMNWLLDYIQGDIPENTEYGFLMDLSTGKTT